MSGGSFDYVCLKEAQNIFEYKKQLKEMVNYLRESKKNDVADEVDRLSIDIEMFERMISLRLKRMHKILRAVEWWASGDYGEKQVDEIWEKFLEGE